MLSVLLLLLLLLLFLYIIKRFRRRRRVKNREGEEGERPNYSKSPQGRIILSPPKAGLFQVSLRPDYSFFIFLFFIIYFFTF